MTPQRQPGEWALEDEIHRGWLFFSFPEALWTGKLLHGDAIHRADSWVLYWFPIDAYGLQNWNDYSSGSQKSLNKGAGLHSFLETPEETPPFYLLQLLDRLHSLAHGSFSIFRGSNATSFISLSLRFYFIITSSLTLTLLLTSSSYKDCCDYIRTTQIIQYHLSFQDP